VEFGIIELSIYLALTPFSIVRPPSTLIFHTHLSSLTLFHTWSHMVLAISVPFLLPDAYCCKLKNVAMDPAMV
jgi:hypothetical protein